MNFNLYLFRADKGTYDQYPDDYTSSIIGPLCSDIKSSKAMIVRDHDLMYYIFAEDLGNSNLFGICLVFNKIYVSQVNVFFNYLRGLIDSDLVRQGKIIRFDEEGDIGFVSANLSDDTKSYDYIKDLIDAKLESENNEFGAAELTTTYNGLHNSTVVSGTRADYEILDRQNKYNKIIIDYEQGLDEDPTRKIISRLQTQIAVLNDTVDDQKRDISRLEKAKKQYRKVIFLFIVLLCCCGGLYFLYATLDETEQNLRDTTGRLNTAQATITSLNRILAQKEDRITSLKNEVREERQQKIQAQNKLNEIQSHCPFIITGTSCSLSAGTYTVKY